MEKSIGLAEANTSARVSIFPKHDTEAPPFVTSGSGMPCYRPFTMTAACAIRSTGFLVLFGRVTEMRERDYSQSTVPSSCSRRLPGLPGDPMAYHDETMGFPVWSSSSSPAALRFLRDHPREMRLLLADLRLRRMDGGELAERARDLDPRIHVVLMVGSGDPHVDDLVLGYLYLPFVAKPVGFADVAAVLTDLLGPLPAADDRPSMRRPRRWQGVVQHQL